MENEDDFGAAVSEMRARVARLEWVLVGGVGIVLGVSALLNVMAAVSTRNFAKIFEDMLGGKPLPFATQWVIGFGESGWMGAVSALLPLGAFVYLSASRRSRAGWFVAVSVIAFLALQLAVAVIALGIPFSRVLWGLQE